MPNVSLVHGYILKGNATKEYNLILRGIFLHVSSREFLWNQKKKIPTLGKKDPRLRAAISWQSHILSENVYRKDIPFAMKKRNKSSCLEYLSFEEYSPKDSVKGEMIFSGVVLYEIKSVKCCG